MDRGAIIPGLLIILVVGGSLFLAADQIGVDWSHAGVGTCIGKHWEPAKHWTTFSVDSEGNTQIHNHYRPESFMLVVRFEDTGYEFFVTRAEFAMVKEGAPVQVLQRSGRMTGWRYLGYGGVISDGRGGW